MIRFHVGGEDADVFPSESQSWKNPPQAGPVLDVQRPSAKADRNDLEAENTSAYVSGDARTLPGSDALLPGDGRRLFSDSFTLCSSPTGHSHVPVPHTCVTPSAAGSSPPQVSPFRPRHP